MGRHQDGAGGKEQGDLAEGVHDDVHGAADYPGTGGEQSAQGDIAQLADSGIGQPRLEIVLAHGHQ